MKNLNFCCACCQKLESKTLLDGSVEKYCSQCDRVFFDAPSPAAIVAVINGDKILLTRSVGWNHPYWGLVAGHVKTGETAEEAAIREVKEEVGLDIKNLNIIGTFASKDLDLLMVGFRADSKNMDINMSQELEKAEWFNLGNDLPVRPCSIASQVISRIMSSP
jgi:NAD+ diphosphatase